MDWSVDYDVRWARRDHAEHPGKTREEARGLWSRTAKDASICAQCFKPLAPTDSVTLEGRTVSRWHGVRVPICLLCTLTGVAEPFANRHFGRTRCLGCGRLLRVRIYYGRRTPLHLSERFCCDDCERKVRNTRNNERRRVKREELVCENPKCGRSFVPTRADQRTCGNTCRQAVHRARVRQASVTGDGVTGKCRGALRRVR